MKVDSVDWWNIYTVDSHVLRPISIKTLFSNFFNLSSNKTLYGIKIYVFYRILIKTLDEFFMIGYQ